ncbi:MAG: cytochrome c-type biogenesis protein CcmH [Chloroflexi bacterium]|nr:cytochrome c-type biogenesis protein CcmH [Chloroflexota bacterium]
MNLRAALVLTLVIASLGVAVTYADEHDADARYARQSRIADKLDCPVCQGQSVKESNAPLAQQMRALINEKIDDGASDEEIFDFFAARYGVGILRDPPKQGLALGVWLGPIVAAAAGVLAVGVVLLRRRPQPVPRADENLHELEARIDNLRQPPDGERT